MKKRYNLMALLAIAAVSLAGFTSCSDDDSPAPVDPTPTVNEITFSTDLLRVKIGSENAVAVPVVNGGGDYSAYSLSPELAEVFKGNDGQYYVEGFKNGVADIVVTDAANQFKRLPVSVYTTDVLQLSHSSLNFTTPLGKSATNDECSVTLGNGEYTIESDNSKVTPSIDSETGEITLVAVSGANDYTATVTVHDCSGLSADISVNVSATFIGYTDADLNNIKSMTSTNAYIDYFKTPDWTRCYYWSYNTYPSYGAWQNTDVNGQHQFGWWMTMGTTDYGGHMIYYPIGTKVGEEVQGSYKWQYSTSQWYDTYLIPGTVKVLQDDDTKTVVVWWDVDMENECINRGYIIKMW